MTNEEKAREMAEEYGAVLAANTDFDVNDLDLAKEDATRLTLDMAEYKDQQFKEYLEKKKECLNGVERHPQSPLEVQISHKLQILNEIINELFKEN